MSPNLPESAGPPGERSTAASGTVKTPAHVDRFVLDCSQFMLEDSVQDAISHLLAVYRLRARIFAHSRYCGSWTLDGNAPAAAVFHVISSGSCWLHLATQREPVPLRGGDLVFFPRGAWHAICDTQIPGECNAGCGSPTPATSITCGFLEFTESAENPVLDSFPEFVLVRSGDSPLSHHIGEVTRLLVEEAEDGGFGKQLALGKLAEYLFVLLIRHCVAHEPNMRGLLAAFADRRICKALTAIHQKTERHWQVSLLAAEAGMSRTAFAQRFAKLVGVTPAQYLRDWRMHLASELLKDQRASVRAVAARAGYLSEAAFRRAYARVIGQGPGKTRRPASLLEEPNARTPHLVGL